MHQHDVELACRLSQTEKRMLVQDSQEECMTWEFSGTVRWMKSRAGWLISEFWTTYSHKIPYTNEIVGVSWKTFHKQMENFYYNEDSRVQQIFKMILASVILRNLLLRDDEKTVEIMNVIWTDVNGDNDHALRDRNDIREVLKGYLNVQHLILLRIENFQESSKLYFYNFTLERISKFNL